MQEMLAILLIFGGGTAIVLSFSPVGRALADRIRGRAASSTLDEGAVLAELEALRADVAELQERVDFSERLLTKGREGDPSA